MSWYKEITNPTVIQPLSGSIESPLGFQESSRTKKTQIIQQPNQIDALKIKKAWDIATGPAKQIPMNLFMSYMSGNSLQMIPIMTTLMLFTGPFKAILTVNEQFKSLESERTRHDLNLAKLTFVFAQLCVVAIGVYKLNSMGLIPNKRGDWLSWEEPTRYLESVLSLK